MKLKFVLFFVLFVQLLFAQQKDTVWFDGEWKKSAFDQAKYYRIVETKEVRFKVSYHFVDYSNEGTLVKRGISLEKESNKFNGEVVCYDLEGNVSERISYKNGVKYGKYRVYYTSGKLKEESTYLFDVLKGHYKSYFENGKVNEIGVYVNGKRDGIWKEHYTNGRLKSNGVYKSDRKVGVWKVFYYNGDPQGES